MLPSNEDAACAINCSQLVGWIVGVSLGIWVAVEFVEPAFNDMHGINDKEAKALTAFVALGGGIEMFAVAGMIAGMVAVTVLACSYSLCRECCDFCKPSDTDVPRNITKNRSTMYATAKHHVERRAAESALGLDGHTESPITRVAFNV